MSTLKKRLRKGMKVVHVADAEDPAEFMRVVGARWDMEIYCLRLRDDQLFIVHQRDL